MVRTGKPEIDRALDELRRELFAASFTSGTSKLKNVVLIDGVATKVAHKLGRRAEGYIVTGCRASAACTVTDNHGTDLDKYLTLTAVGADMTLDLLVF